MLTLQALFDKVVSQGSEVLPSSRIPPLQTAIKQFAAMLGSTPERCTPEQYHLPDAERNAFITRHANPKVSFHTLRNLKNNISFLLKRGVELNLLPKPQSHAPQLSLYSRSDARLLNHAGLKLMAHPDYPVHQRYGLYPFPPTLAAEVQAYADWSTRPFVPNRPARIKKQGTTMKRHLEYIHQVAGFLVYHHGRVAEALTLRDLIDSAAIEAYVTWWVARRGIVTMSIHHTLIDLIVLAQYWFKDAAAAAALRQLRNMLPKAESVLAKSERMLLPEELERIGESIYPMSARQFQESRHLRRLSSMLPTGGNRWHSGRRAAVWAQFSLIIRLWVRRPIRIRNVIEMRLQRNLVALPTGEWLVRFRGEELKVRQRSGKENQETFLWPKDLQERLQEWLQLWRPLLIRGDDPGHVFLNSLGKPHNRHKLSEGIQRTTWKFTGIRVNPHLFRDIWATTYLKSGGKPHVAARRLGNTPEMIHRHYAHLLDLDADREGDEWIQQRLNHGRPQP